MPKSIPSSNRTASIYFNCFSFLLANWRIGKFLMSRNSQQSKTRMAGSHRLDILRTFYYQAVETFLTSQQSDSCISEKIVDDRQSFADARETYWCSEYHKCHAVKEGDQILCILFTSNVPTHTMRLITRKTLKSLLADKQVCW